jgi:outer membrane protein OmpA-like peptidoglycan-associated protein
VIAPDEAETPPSGETPDDQVDIDGAAYVWRGDFLYRRNADGSLHLAEGFLGEGDSAPDPYGQEWLTTDDEGNAVIRVSLRVWATIFFEYNSFELTAEGEEVLKVFADALERPALRERRLLICGHADSRGTDAYNLDLSRRRAAEVARWLSEEGGLDRDRLLVAGYGAQVPVADNATAEGQAKNRRVEFILLR